jgi:hypothetical protein
MGDFLHTVFLAMLFMLFMVALPFALIAATPVILLWPGKKLPGGKRAKKDIEGRYKKLLNVWLEIGKGLPSG